MDYTTDKLRSLVRKWQTLIEAQVDVKTTDGYLLRMFAIAFTKKRNGQVRLTIPATCSRKVMASFEMRSMYRAINLSFVALRQVYFFVLLLRQERELGCGGVVDVLLNGPLCGNAVDVAAAVCVRR